jgi:L-ribulose-5-phosphate 4-epimerase
MTETKKFEHNFNQTSQYNEDTIKQFEATFGKNYMSAGGYETSLETAKLLDPVLKRTNPTILEVGCGIGGASFFFAAEYGAIVHGVDINDVGIQMAIRELEANPLPKGECKFETLDVTSPDCNFEPETFDIIYSRDVILHLDHQSKLDLFAKFKTWLKPGGMICICDYCLGPKSAKTISPEFQAYLDTRGYHLLSPSSWENTFVEGIGFEPEFVEARDCALWYCQICRKEVDRIVVPGQGRDNFLETKQEEDLMKLEKVYGDKINMTLRGDRSYVMVTATKTPSLFKGRKEVSDAYKLVSAKNMIMSCDGNVSRRVDENSFLITPSGVDICDLEAKKVVHCDMNGYSMPGEDYKPSSEFQLHSAIYRARPDVNAIVHTHGIYSCALACCRVPLPPTHYAVCELLGPFDFSDPSGGSTAHKCSDMKNAEIKCAEYYTYGSKPLAEVTSEGLGNHYAVLMANHGAVCVGKDMDYAIYNAERLERECEIYWRCLQMKAVGIPQPLTMGEIKSLHQADEKYGQEHPQEKPQSADEPSLATSEVSSFESES